MPPFRHLAAGALAAVLLAGCGRRETPVEAGDRDQVLLRGVGYEVATLDPQLATGIAEGTILSSLFEGLVGEDPRDLHPIPAVAERWEVSPDGLVYTFHLRPDARWSDGRPVTARDFVESWRRILTPSLGAEYASLLYLLRGAEAFNLGRTRDFSTVGAEALDERTLRVTLDHAAPDFLEALTHWAWMPVPLADIAAEGPVYVRGNAWARPGRLVGDGPFVLASWVPDQEIVVRKSPTYWDAARVRLRAIHFYPIESVDAEERAFRAGQLHITDALPLGKIAYYRRTAPAELRIDPYLDTYYYLVNVRRPFLSDARVRLALALAVDRRAIVGRILKGGETPARAFTPPGLGGYAPPQVLRTDYGEARRLLAEAGHPGGRGLPVFELLYNNSENHRVIAEAVQETWRRELGVEVRLRSEEFKTMLAARRAGNFDIMRANWVADYPDPSTFLDLWRGDSRDNDSGWSDPAYDRLLHRAERTRDPALRNALFGEAEGRVLSQAPFIPVYHYTHVFLIRPSVRGWYPTLLDHHPYQDVWLQP